MLKALQPEDLDRVLELHYEFLNKYRPDVSKEETSKYFAAILEKNVVDEYLLLGAEVKGELVGFLLAYSPKYNPLYYPERNAQEMILYSRRSGEGVKLLKKFEEWAKFLGASIISVTSIDDDERAGALYEKKGYSLYEKHYIKRV